MGLTIGYSCGWDGTFTGALREARGVVGGGAVLPDGALTGRRPGRCD